MITHAFTLDHARLIHCCAPENKSEDAHDAYRYGKKTCQLALRGALERQCAIAIVIHGMVLPGRCQHDCRWTAEKPVTCFVSSRRVEGALP